jgi:hypothetical protein
MVSLTCIGVLAPVNVHTEDILPAILGSDIIRAIPLLLLSDDYSLQTSGALIMVGLAQFC